jgi:hypothetical protein
MAGAAGGCATLPKGDMDRPSTAEIFVEYRRTGGFGGFDDHLVLREDGRATVKRRGGEGEVMLDAKRLDRVRKALDDAGLPSLRDEYRAEGADLFIYRITARSRTITFMDSAVPPPLEPLLRLLNEIVDNSAVPPR